MAEAGERLGQLLMRAGIITDRQLNDALEVHGATGSPLGRVLVDLGYATQGAILSVMAQQIGIEYIDFADKHPEPLAVAVVPKELAQRYTLMPVAITDNTLLVAMADPQNVMALDDLRIITKYEIKPAISTNFRIRGRSQCFVLRSLRTLSNLSSPARTRSCTSPQSKSTW